MDREFAAATGLAADRDRAAGTGVADDGLDGVRVYDRDGRPIGHIHLPERCANVCFGGRHRNRLFMAGAQSLYALHVNTQGAV